MDEKTILLVEDDLDTREALDDLLSDAGYEVIPATSGKQAIDYLLADPSHPPDVVVLDLMLPLVSGWQVLEHIRADPRLASMPVVVTTGVSADRPPGATLVLKKPIDSASLVDEIDRLTADDARRGSRRHLERAVGGGGAADDLSPGSGIGGIRGPG